MRVSGVSYFALVLVGLLVACSGEAPAVTAGDIQPIAVAERSVDDQAAAPVGPPAGEPDPEPADPFALDDPAEVDLDHVDRVMGELLAVSNAVLEDVLTSDVSEGLTAEDIARIGAVHSGPRLIHTANRFQTWATDAEARSAFLAAEERTGTRFETVRMMASDPACIVAIGRLDVSGTAVVPYPDDERVVVVLAAMDAEQRAEHATYNPTPWRLHEMESLTVGDPRVPVPEEEWPDLDYAGVLDLPCVEAVL